MNDVAVTTVLRYMDKQLFEPGMRWPRLEFDRRLYSRWAVCEILELLMDYPFNDVEMVIEDFILKMFYCSHVAENNDKSSFVFTTAIEVAEEILFLCRR